MPRKRLLLLLFIALSLSLMTYQSNRKHFLPFSFLNAALNGFHEVKSSVEDFVASPFKRILLREEENTRLKAELSRMRKEEQEWREAVLENHKRKRTQFCNGCARDREEHGPVVKHRGTG